MTMDPLIVKGFTGTKPNELTGFRYFTVVSTGEIRLLPNNYAFFPDYQPHTLVKNLATTPKPFDALTSTATNGQMGWGNRWFGSSSAGTYSWLDTGGPYDGPYRRKTWTKGPVTTNGDTGLSHAATDNSSSGSNKTGYPVTPGQTFTLSSYFRQSSGTSKGIHVEWYWRDSNGVYISTTTMPIIDLGSDWQRIVHTATAPDRSAYLGVHTDVDTGTLWVAGDMLDATCLMVTEGSTLYPYADGDTPGWQWNKDGTSFGYLPEPING